MRDNLEKLKAKDQMYRNAVENKRNLAKAIEQKKKLYNSVLPRHVKKLSEQVVETTKVFGLEAN